MNAATVFRYVINLLFFTSFVLIQGNKLPIISCCFLIHDFQCSEGD